MPEALSHAFVICAYGESPYLEECIRSLEKQKRKSPILLATSTPNEVIKETAKRHEIPVFVNPGEGGITRDWNFALSCADTEYVTLAHQDDTYGENYTEELARFLEKSRKPLLFFTDYGELREGEIVTENRNLKIKRLLLSPLKLRSLWGSRLVRRRCLSLGNSICCPSVTFAKKNLPEEVFQHHFQSNEDWEAWERLSRLTGDFLYDPKVLMYHRIHESSETSRIIGENKRTEEDFDMFRRFWPKGIAKLLTRMYQSSEKSNKL